MILIVEQFTTKLGEKFSVRYVRTGDKRRIGDGFTTSNHEATESTVEFYDARHTYSYDPLGQFASDYYVRTLLDSYDRHSNYGLHLHSAVPEWMIDPVTAKAILDWILSMENSQVV